MLLQRTLTPRFKLLTQALVESTDGAGTGSDSHERLGDFSDLVGAHSGHEHLHQPVGDAWFIATVAFKGLGVELTRAVSGDFDLLEPASRGRQIARVGAIAIAFALLTAFSPGGSNERI